MSHAHIVIKPPGECTNALQQIHYLQMRGLPANLILRYLKVRYPDLYPYSPKIPKMKDIHIGSLIRQQMDKQNVSVTVMAERLNLQRPNLYRILRNKNINTEMLCRISIVLNYDFFSIYSKKFQSSKKKMNKNDTSKVTIS